MRKNDEKKSSWLLRVIIFLGIILSGLVIFAVSKEIYIKKEVQKQIDQLDTEAQKIEKENMALSDKISYLENFFRQPLADLRILKTNLGDDVFNNIKSEFILRRKISKNIANKI